MLTCKKCRQPLAEGIAQQSLIEMRAALLLREPAISAHRKAMNAGPLCDPCLDQWVQARAELNAVAHQSA